MQELIRHIQTFFEQQAFGVCAWWGGKLKIRTSRIRLYFIYLSFLTMGSPLIIYLFMAFWLEMRNFVKMSRHTIRDL